MKKIIPYVPFTSPSEKSCLINHILSLSREESIPLPKAKQREWSDSFKVMQQIPEKTKTRASRFQLRPWRGLNLVPDMPLPNINHCLSHAELFLPLQMTIHLFSWPSLSKHSLVLVEELPNRVGRNIVFYLLKYRGWWLGNSAGFESVGGWRQPHRCLQFYQKQLCAESGGGVWGAACWVALYLGLEEWFRSGDKTYLGIIWEAKLEETI